MACVANRRLPIRRTIEASPMQPLVPLSHAQRAIVWACWLGGGLLRLIYVLVLHPPTRHVYSDMQGYVQRALNRVAGGPENIGDSLYPPGTSMLFAKLHQLDPTSGLTVIAQWLLSLGTMAGIWVIARALYGNRVAVLALIATTLYLPLFHYAGLFLAENPFTFCLVAAYACLIKAITASRPVGTAMWALAAGLLAGLAASLKATILLPVAVTGIVVIVWLIRNRRRGAVTLAAGVLIGMSTLLLPLAERCTRLAEGHFCLVSTNTGMNALMGHAGEYAEFVWVDPVRNSTYSFTSPSAPMRGYTAPVRLNFGAYDVPANVAELNTRIAADPAAALRWSLRNVVDLFIGRDFWPGAVYQQRNWSRAYQWILQWLLLPLALAWLIYRAPRLIRLRDDSLAEWLLLTPLLGLMLTAFISLGELRFRIPFDGFVIILAAQALLAVFNREQRRVNRDNAPPVLP